MTLSEERAEADDRKQLSNDLARDELAVLWPIATRSSRLRGSLLLSRRDIALQRRPVQPGDDPDA
jgi:hypothetical protein